MKVLLLSQFIFLLIFNVGYAQDNFIAKISGENISLSNIKLKFTLDTTYYENKLTSFKIEESQQNIIISGKIENPYLCELLIEEVGSSRPFMIYEGNNKLRVVKVNGNFVVLREDEHKDAAMLNYLKSFYPNSYDVFSYLSAKEGSDKVEKDSLLRTSYAQTDTTLYNYTKLYPKSYFGLWYIARLIEFGYNTIHGTAFNNLSTELKNSFLGRRVQNEIEKYDKVSGGKYIPNISFQDSTSKNLNLLDLANKKKFTLLSFWYHNCGPCIKKFPDLISIHEKFSHNFQVVGISTDDKNNRDKWLLTVSKYQLPWVNLIDLKQQAYDDFQIRVFPFSYLVDQKGEIVKVNPSVEELKKYLNNQ